MNSATIQRIRELRDTGLTPTAIARQLNAENVSTPRGGRWHPPGVTRALRWTEVAA